MLFVRPAAALATASAATFAGSTRGAGLAIALDFACTGAVAAFNFLIFCKRQQITASEEDDANVEVEYLLRIAVHNILDVFANIKIIFYLNTDGELV